MGRPLRGEAAATSMYTMTLRTMIGFETTGTAASLGLGDHIVVSDESETGDPNRYTNVYSVVQNLRRAALNIELDSGHPIDEDYIVFVDTSEDEESQRPRRAVG